LPAEAFRELHQVARADIPAWAEKWKINAPCVVRAAASIVDFVAVRGQAAAGIYGFGISYQRPAEPHEWREDRARLNRLRVQSLPSGDRATRVLTADPLERLGPIATDPMRESLSDFIARARDHWNARAIRSNETLANDATPPKASQAHASLALHASWLARYHVSGCSIAVLAEDAGRSEKAIQSAILSLARLIGLPPRRRRGRPTTGRVRKSSK